MICILLIHIYLVHKGINDSLLKKLREYPPSVPLQFTTVCFYPSRNAISRLKNIRLWTATYVLVDGTTWAGFCSPGTPPWIQK